MKIITQHQDYRSEGRTVLTIGNFDGVHLGHRRLLEELTSLAQARGLPSAVITFSPHPLAVLAPARVPPLITPASEKHHLIERAGVDWLLVQPFDQALARLSGEEFVQQILVEGLKVGHLLVGANFVFGRNRSGDVQLLRELSLRFGFDVRVVPEVTVRGSRVSSTRIREHLAAGRVTQANRLLGRYFRLYGDVVRGQGLGSKFLFPTLNLRPINELLPAPGVYVTRATFEGQIRPSVTNIGVRPTVSGKGLSVETHLLQTDLTHSPARLEIEILHRLRDERKFESLERLRTQIEIDCHRASRFHRLLERFRSRETAVRTS
ncbi:MAG: bifunctional riboflavin kinase/FAD synthetase [Acidobacteriota bacterium]